MIWHTLNRESNFSQLKICSSWSFLTVFLTFRELTVVWLSVCHLTFGPLNFMIYNCLKIKGAAFMKVLFNLVRKNLLCNRLLQQSELLFLSHTLIWLFNFDMLAIIVHCSTQWGESNLVHFHALAFSQDISSINAAQMSH